MILELKSLNLQTLVKSMMLMADAWIPDVRADSHELPPVHVCARSGLFLCLISIVIGLKQVWRVLLQCSVISHGVLDTQRD